MVFSKQKSHVLFSSNTCPFFSEDICFHLLAPTASKNAIKYFEENRFPVAEIQMTSVHFTEFNYL